MMLAWNHRPGTTLTLGVERAGSPQTIKVVVGAPQESSNAVVINGDGNNDLASRSGAAYVFVRSGSTWSQQAYLKASNATANDTFGSAVAIANDTAIVGAPTKTLTAYQTGATYVFVRSGGSWSEQAFLKITNGGTNDAFGSSVSIFGDTLVSGSVELRVPLNSPLQVARLGVNVFADYGTAYEKGTRLADATFHRGFGGGGWITITALRFGVGVAHGVGAGTRFTFAGGLTF